MTPPTILSANSNPAPRSLGSTSIQQMAYWPCPPVCFTCRPWAWTLALIVSLYGTLAGRVATSTPNLRFMRSTIVSMCASPMPYMTVSWVSGDRSTRSVGSSSCTRARAVESLSSSPFDFGSMAMARRGSGRSSGVSVAVSPLATSVSPVAVWASLATAPMSPAGTSATVSCSLPRKVNSWPTRSSAFRVEFSREESGRARPLNTRNRLIRPTYGSETVLNTRAVSGPFGSEGRCSSVPSFFVTVTGGRSAGEGKASATKWARRSTPAGLPAAPTSTGANFASASPALTPLTISSPDSSPASRYFSSRASSASATESASRSRYGSALAARSSGQSPSSPFGPAPYR